jgi:hypothetical protein
MNSNSAGDVGFLIVEVGIAIITLFVAFAIPGCARVFAPIEKWAGRLANRPNIALLLIGLSAPLIRFALLPFAPVPEPERHDEFSFLLAADTFASGRLTNPTHPMWVHFETFHENHQPTYASMYPPAQGLTLAMGTVVFGHPWYAVSITVGLMCAAIYWMLRAWLPARWALLGGVLVVLRIGILSYWMNSYWGGGISAAGGAMVLGALPRLIRRPRISMSVLLGLGLLILANSRPYEGLLLGLPVATALIVWASGRKRPPIRILLIRVITPLGVVFLMAAGTMSYYNWRVFGCPWTLPYQINRATYAVSPVFIWQSPTPQPAYRHKVMRDFYVEWELPVFERARTVQGFFSGMATKLGMVLYFFFGAILTIPLFMLPAVLCDRRMRFLLWTGGFYAVGLLANAFSVPHYFAPATALFYAVLLQAMRHLRQWRHGTQQPGLFLVRCIPVLCVMLSVIHIAWIPLTSTAGPVRAKIQQQLETIPGRQLAIVRYTPEHKPLSMEWVYNAANIDAAKVVWAREMTPALDQQLIEYFKDRQVWLVEPDCTPPRVSKYAARSSLERKAL